MITNCKKNVCIVSLASVIRLKVTLTVELASFVCNVMLLDFIKKRKKLTQLCCKSNSVKFKNFRSTPNAKDQLIALAAIFLPKGHSRDAIDIVELISPLTRFDKTGTCNNYYVSFVFQTFDWKQVQ